MAEIDDKIQAAIEASDASGLNSVIALLVAITATVMALANIKGQNIVQRMDAAQIERVDQWTLYQAKSTKQNLADGNLHQLRLSLALNTNMAPELRQNFERDLERYTADVARYEQEKAVIKSKAEAAERDYQNLSVFDDQLDVGEACFTVAIALYGVSALVKRKSLLALGVLFSLVGFSLAAAAFARYPIGLGAFGAFLG